MPDRSSYDAGSVSQLWGGRTFQSSSELVRRASFYFGVLRCPHRVSGETDEAA